MVDRASSSGSLPRSEDFDLAGAREKFLEDIHAPSSRSVVAAKLKTIEKALSMCEMTSFPPDFRKIQMLGTVLKAGRYKSAETYVTTYKAESERRGHQWGPIEQRAARDAIRSCSRGLGGPQRALALPFKRLGELPGQRSPWSPRGPVSPRNLVVLGAWFMLREAEAAHARVEDVTIFVESGRPRVVWSLPASKTDQRATGVSRAHGCSCDGAPRFDCPAHAAWDQATMIKQVFGEVSGDFPFFPNEFGQHCTKESMAASFVAAAEHLGVPTESASGRITGHSLRATGAQGLAAAGLELWAVQLLGRWGSMAVRSYVKEAHLEQAESWARRVTRTDDLEEVVAKVTSRVKENIEGLELWKELLKASKTVIEEKSSSASAEGPPKAEAAEALATEALRSKTSLAREDSRTVTSAKGITHEVLLGPPEVELDLAMSSCGWRFGKSAGATLASRSQLPANYKHLCEKCFPEEREGGKQSFASRAAVL